MKIQLVRGAKGEVLGTIGEAAANEVPIEIEPVEGQSVEDVQVPRRELFDVDALHRRLAKQAAR